MKKYLLITSIIVLFLTSCSNKAKNSESEADSVKSDSATIVENEETVTPEILDTPDLRYAELKGNVKSVQTEGYEDLITFNKDGMVESGLPRLKRDSEGRISEWGYSEYFLTWEGDYPKTYTIRESDGGTSQTTYTYDEKGLLIKAKIHSEYPGEEVWDETRQYTYDSFDPHGNWTIRNVVSNQEGASYTEARTITYYE